MLRDKLHNFMAFPFYTTPNSIPLAFEGVSPFGSYTPFSLHMAVLPSDFTVQTP
jgi:hypothetical protein